MELGTPTLKQYAKLKGQQEKEHGGYEQHPKTGQDYSESEMQNQHKNKQKDRNTHNRSTHQSRDSTAEE